MLSDLVKAYERIPHDKLRGHVRAAGFPGRLLALCIRLYSSRRCVSWAGAFTAIFAIDGSIIAAWLRASRSRRAIVQVSPRSAWKLRWYGQLEIARKTR